MGTNIQKFFEYNKNIRVINENNSLDNISNILMKIDKGFKYQSSATNVYCYVNDKSSILVFEVDSYLNIQKSINNNFIKFLGGYNFYKIDKKLVNPFFNNDNTKLESHFYFEKNDFKKIKYFISKILNYSEELNVKPTIKWNGDNLVEILIVNNNKLNDNDYKFAENISNIWNDLK